MKMPLRWLAAHMTMMPVLQAQESLRASSVVAFGSATMKKADARSWARERQREASMSRRYRRRRAPRAKETPQELATRLTALGINVRLVEKTA